MDPVHTVCFLHTIHLVVCDSIYRACSADEVLDEEVVELVDEEDNCDNFTEPLIGSFNISVNFRDTILKVRRIVRYFILSPKKSEILANFVKEQENVKATKLILHCKTRWSSLVMMLKRFHELLPSVRMALINTKSDIEFLALKFKC